MQTTYIEYDHFETGLTCRKVFQIEGKYFFNQRNVLLMAKISPFRFGDDDKNIAAQIFLHLQVALCARKYSF